MDKNVATKRIRRKIEKHPEILRELAAAFGEEARVLDDDEELLKWFSRHDIDHIWPKARHGGKEANHLNNYCIIPRCASASLPLPFVCPLLLLPQAAAGWAGHNNARIRILCAAGATTAAPHSSSPAAAACYPALIGAAYQGSEPFLQG